LLAIGVAPLVLGSLFDTRFDLWPTLLAIGAVAAAARERPVVSGALLGLGFAAKLWPAVLLPLVAVHLWRRRGGDAAVALLAAFLLVAAACFLPFAVLSPQGLHAMFSDQLGRPLQVESLGSSVLLTLHNLVGTPIVRDVSHGSDNLVGSTAHALALEQSVLQTLAIVAIWIWFARSDRSTEQLFLSSAAAVCAFIALGKVLSPQYLAWLLPLVPLVRGRRGAVAGALLLLAMGLTQGWFPYRYLSLVETSDTLTVTLVLARDLTLLALLAVLAYEPGMLSSRPT
jgi:hypothetical protein